MNFSKFYLLIVLTIISLFVLIKCDYSIDCNNLFVGQYSCDDPFIDPKTQQPINCFKNNTYFQNCTLIDDLKCQHNDKKDFKKLSSCSYTNGYHFHIALLLSIFGGTFGLDRFYLGYYAFGILKLFSFGGFFFLQLVDIILIALQVLKPADNSSYIMDYYGPKITLIHQNEM